MDSYTAFKLYTAVKLHFTTSYDVFKSKGAVKVKMETFVARRDVSLFERLSKMFVYKAELIEFLVANFACCNDNLIYDLPNAIEIHKQWLANKQRISYQFNEDVSKLFLFEHFTSKKEEVIITAFLSKEIQPQTLAILDSEFGVVTTLLNTPKFVMIHDVLKRLSKLKQFVKYEKSSISDSLNTLVDLFDA